MCDTCNWSDLLDEIKAMCAATGYEFADQTLSGIHDRVKLVRHATERQKEAVMNIKKSKKPRPLTMPSQSQLPRYGVRFGKGRREG